MSDSDNAGEPREGEVLEPEAPQGAQPSPDGDNYIALISQYTERPDLLINTLEQHDPGFVARMNKKAEDRADRMATAKFWFGGIQAYAGLAVSVIAALVLLGLVVYAVINGHYGFWFLIGAAVFYAITQGGPSGFAELCRGVASFFGKNSSRPPD